MQDPAMNTRHALNTLFAGCALALLVTACGGPAPSTDATALVDNAAAELATKEAQLAEREAALAQKEAEQQEAEAARLAAEEAARVESEAAAAAAAAAAARKPVPAKSSAAASKPATSSSSASTTAKPAAPPPPLVVPAGTTLTVALSSAVSTKTAKVGDPISAQVVSDVLVGNRVAVPAGSRVSGTVTQVVSGSNKIGGVPVLGLRFDTLQLVGGQSMPISGEIVQQGRSDTGMDTAKILGGAAAGAVVGHQVDDDKGKVIGGLLGGAAGAVAAKKTGAEVQLAQDSTLAIALGAPIEVAGR
jgi:hypothetical protein